MKEALPDLLPIPKGRNHYWTGKESKLWSVVLFIGAVALYAARVSLPICIVAIGKQYEWSKSDSGMALSSFFWGYACTQIMGGWLADRMGGERVLLFTGLVWAMITLLFPGIVAFAHTTTSAQYIVAFFRVLMGATQGMMFPSIASLTGKRMRPADRTRAFGTILAGSHLGTLLCGSIGSLILDLYEWQSVFYFIGGFSLLWWLYLRYLVLKSEPNWLLPISYDLADETSLMSDRYHQSVPLSPSGSSLSSMAMKQRQIVAAAVSSSPTPSVPWLILFRKMSFWAAVIAHYFGANAFFTLFSWLPSYFTETFPDAKAWVFNVIPNMAVFITGSLSPTIASRLIARGFSVTRVRKVMECTALCGMALCLFMVGSMYTFKSALVCLAFALGLRGFHHGGVAVNAQDFAPNHAGAVFGFQNTAAAIPGFIGVYVAGQILEKTHSWPQVFTVTAAQCVIGAIVYAACGTGLQII